jgi:hypothetical protein
MICKQCGKEFEKPQRKYCSKYCKEKYVYHNFRISLNKTFNYDCTYCTIVVSSLEEKIEIERLAKEFLDKLYSEIDCVKILHEGEIENSTNAVTNQ